MLGTSIDRTSFGHTERFDVIVPNACMSPRFNPGDMLIIEKTAVPRIGEDVLIEIPGAAAGLSDMILGRLVNSSKHEIVLRQFNPSRTVTVPTCRVRNIYPIIGCEFADRRIRRRVTA
jgi:hypothetical protein